MHCITHKKNLNTFLQQTLADEATWFTFTFSMVVSNLNAPVGGAWALSGLTGSRRKLSNVFLSNDSYLRRYRQCTVERIP